MPLDDMLNTNSNPEPASQTQGGSANLIDDLLNVFDGGSQPAQQTQQPV